MDIQIVRDSQGNPVGVFIPMVEWQHLKKQLTYLSEYETNEKIDEHLTGGHEAFKQVQKVYSVELIRQTHPAAYAPWTNEEEYKLKIMYFEGKSINEIANELGRKNGAILSRLKKLNIDHVP